MDLPAHIFLDGRHIPYKKLSFPPETEKGAANVAQALGYNESQMVKTLVFESGTGEQVLVMLGGDKNAISGNLKRAIGSRDIRLAAHAKVIEVTGYAIGAIPPFHWQPPGFRTFIDACLMDEGILGGGAGQGGGEVMIAPNDRAGVSGGTVVEASKKRESPGPGRRETPWTGRSGGCLRRHSPLTCSEMHGPDRTPNWTMRPRH